MSTITSLNPTDSGETSRGVINTNFDNLNTDKVETSVLDTDTSLTANSDAKVATQKATKAYADTKVASTDIDTDGTFTANSDTKVPSQKAVKTYVDATGAGSASTTTRGGVEIATLAEVDAGTATGGTSAALAVTPDTLKDSLPFTIQIPESGAAVQGVYSDKIAKANSSSYVLYIHHEDHDPQRIDTTTAVTGADGVYGAVFLGDYVYALVVETSTTPDTWSVVRYLISDPTTYSVMTFSGSNQIGQLDGSAMRMTSDGTDIYISHLAGNSANSYEIGRYTISGTTLTYADTTSLGTEDMYEFIRLADGTWITHSTASTYTVMNIYASNGTLTRTVARGFLSSGYRICCLRGYPYRADAEHLSRLLISS